MGTTCGFRIYSLNPFKEIVNSELFPIESQTSFVGGISQVAVLYQTQIVTLAGVATNDKLSHKAVLFKLNKQILIFDCHQKKQLHERTFTIAILNLLMVRDRLIVVTESNVCVYNIINNFSIEQEIKTFANPYAICAINSDDKAFLLATLGKTKGTLRVDEYKSKFTTVIKVFENSIQNISISQSVI